MDNNRTPEPIGDERPPDIGQQVVFVHQCGVVTDPSTSTRFVAEVEVGQVGIYRGPHPSDRLEGWHLVEVEVEGQTLFAPVVLGLITWMTV